MSITRDPSNLFGVVEYTKEINELDRQYSLVPDGLFEMSNTTQTAIIFDKDERSTTLLSSVHRNSRGSTYNQDRNFKTYSLPLAYFKHTDYLYPEDVRSVRMMGTPDEEVQLNMARAKKIEQMRRDYDQTMEYMKFRCITQAKCISPNGVVFADLYDEFGETQVEVTWDLTDANFDLGLEARKLKRLMRDGMKDGGNAVDGLNTVYIEATDYDALVGHANVKDAYRDYAAIVSPLRDDVTEGFTTNGLRLQPLDGSFTVRDNDGDIQTEDIMTVGEAYAVPLKQGIFRGWAGPHNKLPNFSTNSGVQDLYLWEKLDSEGEFWKYQLESSPLMVHTRPLATIKINIVTA